ncbi:sigma-70 family RNA polymerase sigma factor [Paenibacillus ginsengarvi]|uniref:Sigma-70 family RNA polymerase sigma factor n=1 Tax=Paenibacillus ginsengarvi TaxID=400777 RepID=A0A3B0CCH8_9BACL|nr:sigma-70 family RNA polymerase sigma factor [Paenibacillus ginsengarvi]RKN80656.1 sigma-70 family RNA polymerase sigma factor [Paenibacillus ginsengarvi]
MEEQWTKHVRRAQKGSHDDFVQLICMCEGTMYRVAKSIMRTENECADAMQEAIAKAYKSIRALNEPKYFKTWLIRILINECRKMKQLRKRVIPVAEIGQPSYDPELAESFALAEAVRHLDEELRVLVQLYYVEDLPLKDVAALLGQPEGTVKSRLARAREKLARELDPAYGKESLL